MTKLGLRNRIFRNNDVCSCLIVIAAFLFFALLAGSCDRPQQPVSAPAVSWTGTWGCAQQLVEPHNMPPEPGLSNNTLQQIVRVSIGGESFRVRFSNEFSSNPTVLKEVHVAVSAGGSSVDPGTDTPLYFKGQSMISIDPGMTVTSDPFSLHIKPQSDISISVYFGAVSQDITGHPGSRTTSFLKNGNALSHIDMPDAVEIDHWYIIDSIDVLAPESASALVVMGDSITDGRGSGTNRQNRWTNELSRRFYEDPETRDISVLNMGLGGNCVIRECLGPAAVSRFERDALMRNGVKWLIIMEGINDIGQAQGEEGSAETAEDLIAAYEHMIYLARSRGIIVYGATLMPFGGSFYDSEWHETCRQTVNEWIRNSNSFDGVIDMDKAMRDPDDPSRLIPVADTGDHLHPNETGHRMMAEAVDLNLFKN